MCSRDHCVLAVIKHVVAIGVLIFQAHLCEKGSRNANGWDPPSVVNLPDTVVIVNEDDIVIEDGGPVNPVRQPLMEEQRSALQRTSARVVRDSFWRRVMDGADAL